MTLLMGNFSSFETNWWLWLKYDWVFKWS